MLRVGTRAHPTPAQPQSEARAKAEKGTGQGTRPSVFRGCGQLRDGFKNGSQTEPVQEGILLHQPRVLTEAIFDSELFTDIQYNFHLQGLSCWSVAELRAPTAGSQVHPSPGN